MGRKKEQQPIPGQGELFPGVLKPDNGLTEQPGERLEKAPEATMPISRDTTTSKVNDNGESGQKPEDNTSVKKYNDRYNNNVELSDIALRRANPDKWWLYID